MKLVMKTLQPIINEAKKYQELKESIRIKKIQRSNTEKKI